MLTQSNVDLHDRAPIGGREKDRSRPEEIDHVQQTAVNATDNTQESGAPNDEDNSQIVYIATNTVRFTTGCYTFFPEQIVQDRDGEISIVPLP